MAFPQPGHSRCPYTLERVSVSSMVNPDKQEVQLFCDHDHLYPKQYSEDFVRMVCYCCGDEWYVEHRHML